jgi:hypothetical protein
MKYLNKYSNSPYRYLQSGGMMDHGMYHEMMQEGGEAPEEQEGGGGDDIKSMLEQYVSMKDEDPQQAGEIAMHVCDMLAEQMGIGAQSGAEGMALPRFHKRGGKMNGKPMMKKTKAEKMSNGKKMNKYQSGTGVGGVKANFPFESKKYGKTFESKNDYLDFLHKNDRPEKDRLINSLTASYNNGQGNSFEDIDTRHIPHPILEKMYGDKSKSNQAVTKQQEAQEKYKRWIKTGKE